MVDYNNFLVILALCCSSAAMSDDKNCELLNWNGDALRPLSDITREGSRRVRLVVSFESDRGSGPARPGWRKERCQPRMAVCAVHLHDHSQNAIGTQRAELSHKDFLLPFLVFSKMKPPPGGDVPVI